MENTFKHTADNHIHIGDFICQLEDFLTVEPDYSLPEFFIGREYVKGVSHRLYTNRNEIYLDSVWEKGDEYLSKKEFYSQNIPSLDALELAKQVSD